MIFHSRFPKSFAAFLAGQSEYKVMLLLIAIIILFNDNQCELLLLKVKLHNPGPKEESYLLYSFINQDSCKMIVDYLQVWFTGSKNRQPVGVSPNEYWEPSLPRTVWVATPYISKSLASDKYSLSASEGLLPLKIAS